MEAQVNWVYERSKTCETKDKRASEVNLGFSRSKIDGSTSDLGLREIKDLRDER